MTLFRWPHTSLIQLVITPVSQPWQRASFAKFQMAMVESSAEGRRSRVSARPFRAGTLASP
jgi:hypothetical protein